MADEVEVYEVEVYEVEVVNATTNLWLPEEWHAMTEDLRLWVDNDGSDGTQIVITRRAVSRAEYDRQRRERDGDEAAPVNAQSDARPEGG